MRIVFFSDPHGQHDILNLPEADIAICCGDISMSGTKTQVKSFLDWYSSQPHKYKIMIAGNHDFWFEPSHPRNRTLLPGENPRALVPDNIIYLEDDTIVIEGIKIFGSPWTPWFHSWAFNAQRGDEIKKHWDLIESDTDIIVVHGPPSGTHLERCRGGDMVGCMELSNRIAEVKPKICSFGHIHEAYGIDDKEIIFGNPENPGKITRLINCSVLNLQYELVNAPFLVDWDEICKLHENKKV
ncbi:MAG: metallophosphoesterase family protein [Nanoarchaeota archaeon]